MSDNTEVLALTLESCLDWLDNLELTIGSEVMLNHAPNNTPSRNSMRALIGMRRHQNWRCPDCGQIFDLIEQRANHPCRVTQRTFAKEQLRLLRNR